MRNKYYEHIYEEFLMYYGSDTVRIINWEPAGKREILVYYEDGSKARYDSMTKAVYNIRPRSYEGEFIDDDIYTKRFAWKLRTEIYSSGLSRDEICERTGISNAALSGYMNGNNLPTASRICKLAKVLKCSVTDLLNVDDWDK